MSEISVGSAVGAGFGLITRRPLSVLTWGLLRVGFLVAFFAIYAPTLISMITEITQQARADVRDGRQPLHRWDGADLELAPAIDGEGQPLLRDCARHADRQLRARPEEQHHPPSG